MEYNGFSTHSITVLFISGYFNSRSVILVLCLSLPFIAVKRRYRHCHAPSGVALSQARSDGTPSAMPFLVDSINSYLIVYMIFKMDFAFIVFLTFIAWITVFTTLGLCIQMLLKTLKEKHFQSSEKSWKEWKSFCHLSVDNDGYSPVTP